MEEKKKYDLDDRTLKFLKKDVMIFIRKLSKDFVNVELGRQLIRASGSVGANYREANDSISRKDFEFRIRICRKEAKESCFWLSAFDCSGDNEETRKRLAQEAFELVRIFGSIVKNFDAKRI